jgi:hypothetical protein
MLVGAFAGVVAIFLLFGAGLIVKAPDQKPA